MQSPSVVISTSSIGYSFDILIQHWCERLTAYRRYSNGQCEKIEGGIGIGLNFIEGGEHKSAWLSKVPRGLIDNTEAFPEHQYQMLWLAANSVNAEDILTVRPLILALICERYPVDNQMALSLAKLGQRDILKQLGFASTKSALKFIDKLTLTYERSSEILHVIKMLDVRTSHFRKFRHYIKVNF
ncbi:hypothetical protein [Vibrio genomosp. F10]|uniref:Uncharacterized protein n=1 Tax=Vibrio genomosp. F10 TaxID=723171 RepID=A0A1B9R314_9VIBR|nr:hypothetical protein [Vibrio genomosp. F10]OCH78562.1 hypothetical protein A6E14_17315 [Vibrio genomosp. F10]